MNIPPFLKPGDTIAVTAPSFGATTEPYKTRFSYAIEKFRERGYKIDAGKTCFKSDGLGISSDPKVCARELEDFYCSEEIQCIISCGGGELMCETAGFIDFSRIKNAPPKWFMGYSDNTNFIHPLLTLCNTASVYGPTITGFGKPWEKSEDYAIELLEGKISSVQGFKLFQNPQSGTEAKQSDPLSKYVLDETKHLKLYKTIQGKAVEQSENLVLQMEGIFAGGCLDVLANLAGSPLDGTKQFAAENKKIIWILEACDLNPMDIRRAMWRLDKCGWFENAAGFIIGRPLASYGQELMGVNQYNAVTDIISKYNADIIMDADIGHISPVVPVAMGTYGKAETLNGEIFLNFDIPTAAQNQSE